MDTLKKICFPIAAVFIIAALAIKTARPEWQMYANIGAGIGVLFFLVSLYFERAGLKNFFSARSTRHGLNSLVLVLFVLAILILTNWIVARHPVKYDTTKNKQFSLSPMTLNVLKDLKKPVTLTAFYRETQDENERGQMKERLDLYKVNSKNLEVKMVDPIKDPLTREKFGITTPRTTVLESGKQRTTISTMEEEDITNAILKVTTEKQAVIYFLQGHGEPSITEGEDAGFTSIVDLLKKRNYEVKELKNFMAKPKIPADCTVMVASAPRVTLLDSEIKAIQDFLAAGGRLIMLDTPQSDPSFAKILSGYPVRAEDDVVLDNQYFYPAIGPQAPLAEPKPGTPVTKEFNYEMFFPISRSIDTSADAGSATITPFASSSDSSWGETDKQKGLFEEGTDKKGPLTLAVLYSKTVEKKEGQSRSGETRLTLFGGFSFIQNGFIGLGANHLIFLNCVAWLTEQENLIHLPPKNTRSDTMVLNSSQVKYIGILLVIVLPIAILTTGIVVWKRRKRL